VNKEWIAQTVNGRYVCTVCTAHQQAHVGSAERSPWLAGNGGVIPNQDFSKRAIVHEESDMHQLSMDLDETRKQDPIRAAMQNAHAQSRAVTANLFRTALDGVIHYRSFLDYERIVHLQVNPLLPHEHMGRVHKLSCRQHNF